MCKGLGAHKVNSANDDSFKRAKDTSVLACVCTHVHVHVLRESHWGKIVKGFQPHVQKPSVKLGVSRL